MRLSLRHWPRASRRLLWVGILCAVALTVEALVLFVPSSPTPNSAGTGGWPAGPFVSVLGVDLIVSYVTNNRSDTNFLLLSDCGCEPVNVSAGQEFQWWVKLSNTDTAAHHLNAVQVDAPFRLVGVVPSPPVILPGAGTVNITLEIQAPTQTGGYDITGSWSVTP